MRLSIRRDFHLIPVIFLAVFLFIIFFAPIQAEPNCDNPSGLSAGDLQFCIEKIDREFNAIKPAHEKNKEELAKLKKQLDDLKRRIVLISTQLKNLEAEIVQREEDLAFTQEIFEEKTSNHYRFIRLYDPILPFLASEDAATAFREINFRQRAADDDRKTMEKYAEDLVQLKSDKETLEKNKASLASAQKKISDQEKFLAGEVAKVESYLASLTAKQQQFIAQKLGSLNLPRSALSSVTYCVDDRNRDPGFSPAFALFTYGIPHRVGMSQYGARGRASSQGAEDILRAYFQNIDFASGFEGRTVTVNGTNEFGQSFNNESMNIEEYLKHLYEMPTSWNQNALQAQAIAARSYALAVMESQGYLRPSQSDQVIKRELNDGNWVSAVTATPGRVMVQGGKPIKAWYASTAGGYTFNSGDVWSSFTNWTKRLRDTNGDVGSFGDLNAKAYDRESPCFYTAQGWRKSYANSAWLKSEELADIVNVILLARKDSSTREHLYQTDKPNPAGTDTWSVDRVKEELRNKGGTPFNSISSISINGADWSSGITTSVTVSGDGGSESFSGTEFKDFFNLRAPANIQIVGPLFNVERKG